MKLRDTLTSKTTYPVDPAISFSRLFDDSSDPFRAFRAVTLGREEQPLNQPATNYLEEKDNEKL